METEPNKIIIIGDIDKITPKLIENIKEHYDSKIMIVTPETDKMTPDMIGNIKEHYDREMLIAPLENSENEDKINREMIEKFFEERYACEVKIVTPKEYEDFKKEHDIIMGAFANECMEREKQELELFLRRMDGMDYLPSITGENRPIQQEYPRKIGKVNNKKLAPAQKQYNNRKRGR